MYNEYEVTEAEYNEIKQQYLERKINIDRIYYVKELNVMYTFNYTSRSTLSIIETKIIDGKKEVVSKEKYIDGVLHSKTYYNGEFSIKKIYNDADELDRTYYKKNDILHRTDGPAVEYNDKKHNGHFYVDGTWVNDRFFNKMVKNIKNGRIIHILNNYNYKDLLIIKTMVEEIGNKEELDAVNKYILIRKLEGES